MATAISSSDYSHPYVDKKDNCICCAHCDAVLVTHYPYHDMAAGLHCFNCGGEIDTDSLLSLEREIGRVPHHGRPGRIDHPTPEQIGKIKEENERQEHKKAFICSCRLCDPITHTNSVEHITDYQCKQCKMIHPY